METLVQRDGMICSRLKYVCFQEDKGQETNKQKQKQNQ